MLKPSIKTVIGFDFGMRKIGIAVGQIVTQTASPQPQIKATDGIPHWPHIAEIIERWHPDALIVGLPLNLDGSDQDITFSARKFARRLEAFYHLPVFLMDERLTTKTARRDFGKQAHKKSSLDSLAAVLIVESWLREHANDPSNA
jgi:putative Holliday junction resolvase